MTRKTYDDSLMARVLRGEIDRRDFLRQAGTLTGSPMLLKAMGATGGAATLATTARSAGAQDGPLLLTCNNEQQATWIRNFNPLMAEGATHRWPTRNAIYEPLFTWNTATATAVPWLATEWSFSDDNLTLTVNLREGVTWSDGEAFDSADVVFTWNALIENEALPGNGARAAAPYLASVEAVDELTVAFNFSEVFTIAVYQIGGQVIVPEHIFSSVEDLTTFTNEEPVGTGPFTNVARFEDQIFELHKNETYWQEGKPAIAGLRLPAFPSNDAVQLAGINGEIDWQSNFIPDIENTYIAEDPEHHNYWFPPIGAVVHLYLNTEVAPFDDVNVRKAVSLAINRDQICEIAMFGYTHPADATGLSDAFTSAKDETALAADWVTFDVDRANQMLDDAGYARDGDVRKAPDGTAFEFELNVVSGWSDWVQSCEIMARNLSEIGFNVTVQPYDQTTWQTRVQNGEFTMSIGWASQGPTVWNFYRAVMGSDTKEPIGTSAGENWHRYASEEADALLLALAATSDEAEQADITAQLQNIYANEAPAVPLFPGPQWGQFNDTRFVGFPSEENPYAILSTWDDTRGIVMTTVTPREDA